MLVVSILVASVVPVPTATPQTDPTGTVATTTLLHIAGYATLAAGSVAVATRRGLSEHTSQQHRHVGARIVAVALFGVGTELLQGVIPWRTFAVAEIGLNAASAVAGGLLAAMWFYRPVE
ncbi:MAG: VanZ like family [Halonotius sp. J07HN4]|nr:MAG: VanZ like family [Halonotius sp. J07HN4]